LTPISANDEARWSVGSRFGRAIAGYLAIAELGLRRAAAANAKAAEHPITPEISPRNARARGDHASTCIRTAFNETKERQLTEHDKAGQARKSLMDSVKGKVKEVVGAVTGSDSLTKEGQLEQIQAQARKEANAVDAVADAEAAQAREEIAEATGQGARERVELNTRTAAAQNSARADAKVQKSAAAQAHDRDATRDQLQAEMDAQREMVQAKAAEREEISEAAEEITDAQAKHQSSAQVANATHADADRIRQQADKLTNEADLP
jgi:uncharacterized protein YjbJ (UPF0337 family)